MRVVVLAGGLGTRLAEETDVRPKPMVEIGGRPILWHILRHYSRFEVKESVIALGYRGEVIKRFFVEYADYMGDLSVDLANRAVTQHEESQEDWRVHLVDTGSATNTGGRVKRLADWCGKESFHLTYGDGVSNVDINELLRFHRRMGRTLTLTAVRPPARFGGIEFNGEEVSSFTEKPQAGDGWINGGFMVCERKLFDYLENDGDSLEKTVLERLAAEGELAAYRHYGFWQCMDTLRDKQHLEAMWRTGNPPWQAPNCPVYDQKIKLAA